MASSMTFDYGESNFRRIRMENLYFADNTRVIRDIENHHARHMLLCRPPRFGKSLLLSMMQLYYDGRTSDDEFHSLFSNLNIGQNPTPSARSYKVLQLSLTINTLACADALTIMTAVNSCVNSKLRRFKSEYDLSFPLDDDACSSLESMCTELEKLQGVERKPQRLLILIDEYDRLANMLLEASCHDDSVRQKLAPIKNMFMCLKDLSTRVNISQFRTFTVGISPLPLAQMSVWNMVDDLSLNPKFACALGLTDQHVASALEQLGLQRESPIHQNVLELLRHYFNGYCFAGSDTTLFNPQMVVRFCQLYTENATFEQLVKDPEWRSWDDALQVRDFMNNSDANVLPAESLFRILDELPICTTTLLLALTIAKPPHPAVSVTASAIRNGLKPSEMKSSLDQVLWFMYFHGLVTCTAPSADSTKPSGDAGTSASKPASPSKAALPLPIAKSYGFRLPNKLVCDDHLAELARRLSRSSDCLERLLSNPSATSLRELLWSVVSPQETEHSDNFIELSLQGELEAALRVMCSKYELLDGSQPRVHASYKLRKDGEEIECDLLILWSTTILHMELKRVKPGDIDFGDKKAYSLKNVIARTNTMTEADLRQLAIWRKAQHGGCCSVEELRMHAIQQLHERLPLLHNEWPGRHVHQFAVVQVGWPLLVEEVTAPL